jgi:hypothetical protein
MRTFGDPQTQTLVSVDTDAEGNPVLESLRPTDAPSDWQPPTLVPLVKTAAPNTSASQRAEPKLVWFEDRVERQWDIVAAPVPKAVPFRSLAFALLEAGIYPQVKAAALATPEGEIWWNTAQSTTVQRDHPFVAALATAVGQTPEQIDAIFAAAAATEA